MKKLFCTIVILLSFVSCTKPNYQEYMVGATLWHQSAPEAKALYYQAFNLARLRLDQDLANKELTGKRAIVVDIDETLVNNSNYQGEMIKTGIPFTKEGWLNHIKKEDAWAVPGAVEFISYAQSKGVRIFFISNRLEQGELDPTISNLTKLGFNIKKEDCLFKTTTSSKEARRKIVYDAGYRVVLFMGDAMGDFNDKYGKVSYEELTKVTDGDKNQFGLNYIVLPNPMYGHWEQASYNYNHGLSEAEKMDQRVKSISDGLN